MGRSYWFECARCGFRAKISGGPDRGAQFFVQTILCLDCKQLYDAVTRIRCGEHSATGASGRLAGLRKPNLATGTKRPPTFDTALNRLLFAGVRRAKWSNFPMQCPLSPNHRVQSWNDPDKCPCCGLYLEKNALPYRIWE